MSDDEREEKELDLSSAEVVTKYKTAAEIVNSLFLTLLMPLWSQILFGFWLFHTLDTIFPGTLLKFIFFNLYFLVQLRFDVFFLVFIYDFTEALKLVISECKPKRRLWIFVRKGIHTFESKLIIFINEGALSLTFF